MVVPINNRCTKYFQSQRIPYIPLELSYIQKELNKLVNKDVVILFTLHNKTTPILVKGPLLWINCDGVITQKGETPSHKISLRIQRQYNREELTLTDGDIENDDTEGIIHWIGTVERYEKLKREGYFEKRLAAARE